MGKQEIALLTQHYYRGDGQNASSTDAELITADTVLATQLSQLQGGAEQIGIPFRISELEMTGSALNATTGVMIQGAAIGQDGSFAPSFRRNQ